MDTLKRLHTYSLSKRTLIHSMGRSKNYKIVTNNIDDMFVCHQHQKRLDLLFSSKTLLEMGRVEESIMKHKAEIQIAKKSGIDEIKIRAMDNLAVRIFFRTISSVRGSLPDSYGP